MRFHSFSGMLTHWAGLTPDAPALRQGEQELTFSRLLQRVSTREAELREQGLASLGVLCDGSAECVVTLLAAPGAGVRTVLLDETADPSHLREMIAAARVGALWGDGELREELESALTREDVPGPGEMLFFTSGTTRRAKSAVLTQQSLCASAFNGGALLPLRPEDTLLCLLPLNHVFGFVCGLLWGLSCGACVALGRGPRHYFDDFAYYRPTAVSLVPALLAALLKGNCLDPELRLALIGAGDCPAPLLNALRAKRIRVSFGYGLTETSSGVALSLGEDPFAMTVCPDDRITLAEDGEILIQAPTCMMQGYFGQPEETARVLRSGVLHTGDLGRLDENGLLHVTGRKKEILVLPDGTKLFLPEYEQALQAALGGRELAVILHRNAPALVARGTEAERAELSARLAPLNQTLPRGQQIKTIFLTPSPLPRTATGKIKRWEVAQAYDEK